MKWEQIKQKAIRALVSYSDEYKDRLEKEFEEIEKQGANYYWEESCKNKVRWVDNESGLVMPFLLGMTSVDPIAKEIPHIETRLTDFPDIDLDFIPDVRQSVKDYAKEKYKNTCNVGYWVTFKPRSALLSVVKVHDGPVALVQKMTKNLPDEFDEMTLDELIRFRKDENHSDPEVRKIAHKEVARYHEFYVFLDEYPKWVDYAFRLCGKITAHGRHAGGVIIADMSVPIDEIVPLSKIGGQDDGSEITWTSQWTEGRSTQLSKFGLIKFDILGVKTLYYLWQAGELVKKNRGIEIEWVDMDPLSDPPRAGWRVEGGERKPISLNDDKSIKMCNDLRTDSVFQIETTIQKSIISDGGVKTFWDLVIYNALGRPGPMDMIPEYIKRRDGKIEWEKGVDPRITEILKDTFNIIVYQEQLTAIWIKLANFTVPEAETARKIISKKWQDKLPEIEKKWKAGASKEIGEESANNWWDMMVTFGRYAFNKSHSLAYSLITYRCLYMKAHFAAEWWAAVMTECPSYKLSSYRSAARLEGVKFGCLDINNLTHNFSVKGNSIISGLKSIKGIGDVASTKFTSTTGPFANIDDMVEKCGKAKNVFERLIKLGAFDEIHLNRRGLWMWYQYKYCSGKDITALKKEISAHFEWSEDRIVAERKRQEMEFKKLHPNRKVPVKILNWKFVPAPIREEVIGLYDDYSVSEKLDNEKDLLGYFWSSPLEIYNHKGLTIEMARIKAQSGEDNIKIEGVIEKIETRNSSKGNKFYVIHITDGIQNIGITIWESTYISSDRRIFEPGVGVRITTSYSAEFKSFRIANNTHLYPLTLRKDGDEIDIDDMINHEEYPLW